MAHTLTNSTYTAFYTDQYQVNELDVPPILFETAPLPTGVMMMMYIKNIIIFLLAAVLYILITEIFVEFLNRDDEEDNSECDKFKYLKYLLRPKYKIYATGKWRTNEERYQKLLSYFHPDDHDTFMLLSQTDEAINQGISAFEIFKRAYGTENTLDATIGSYFMAFIAGQGSTQIVIFDADGNVQQTELLDVGIPKNESTIEQMDRQSFYNQTINEIADKFEITHAIFCDSMFHIIKETDAPIVKDGSELPQLEDIPTMDAFVPYYGFGEAIKNARTLVIRNVKMPKTDNGGGSGGDSEYESEGEVFETPIYKTSFISGDVPIFDLGTGKIALVDGKTGQQIAHADIGDWENNDDDLLSIAELISFTCVNE